MYPFLQIGSLQIPNYFLVSSLVACVCMIWLWRRAVIHNLNGGTALDISLVIFICGFIGARILHIVWEEPRFYIEAPSEIFNIFAGGYVYLGGLIGAAAGVYGYCRIKKEPFLLWADLSAPVIALGYGLGRLACFMRGCCYGIECNLPWAVSFMSHDEMGIAVVPRHPTQIYALVIELLIVWYLLLLEKRGPRTGYVFFTWLIAHGTARVFLEIFRDDPRGYSPMGLSLSTWIGLAIVCLAVRYRVALSNPVNRKSN